MLALLYLALLVGLAEGGVLCKSNHYLTDPVWAKEEMEPCESCWRKLPGCYGNRLCGDVAQECSNGRHGIIYCDLYPKAMNSCCTTSDGDKHMCTNKENWWYKAQTGHFPDDCPPCGATSQAAWKAYVACLFVSVACALSRV
eukprot:TRINITY_DN7164_c0_g1_i1.p1 TRINITY_DN7164_c0_g1~~TRINITY_DN7164_c0_g1_i1.p1  ORF type:complete len:142 (-),score=7.86 TRINITY_DN7164_c0_g1_i1:593-1018(-)